MFETVYSAIYNCPGYFVNTNNNGNIITTSN